MMIITKTKVVESTTLKAQGRRRIYRLRPEHESWDNRMLGLTARLNPRSVKNEPEDILRNSDR